jgi:cation transport ATPase
MPAEAHLVIGGRIQEVKTDSLKEKDTILMKPGEKVAADGVIVDDAQKSKSKTQLLADTAAKWLTVVALLAGLSAFFYWHLSGQSVAFAMARMVTVMVICCPHALGLAAALEERSEHPIATGILQKAKELSIVVPAVEDFTAMTGKGVAGTVEGKKILVVSPGYLVENKLSFPEGFSTGTADTVVFVIVNGLLAGYIALSDQIRPESAMAVKTLKKIILDRYC